MSGDPKPLLTEDKKSQNPRSRTAMDFPSNLRIEEESNLTEDGMISYRLYLYFRPTSWYRNTHTFSRSH